MPKFRNTCSYNQGNILNLFIFFLALELAVLGEVSDCKP